MNHLEFAELLKQGRVPSVLFFEGPEEHLKQAALRDLRRVLLPEGLEEMNETRLEAPSAGQIIEAAETLPFLAERRLVLLRDYPAIVGRGEADEDLIAYLSKVPDTAVLVFYCVQKVKQQKIRNAVKKLGGLVEFTPLKGPALTSFVTEAFRAQGRECDERTADLLIFISGSDTNQLLNEVAKISSLHPEEPKLNPEDVRLLATPSAESRIFTLVDAVIAGQETRAFALLSDLLHNGETRVGILAMLLRQFRLLQHVKIMQYEHKSQSQIMEAMGIGKPFILKEYLRQASLFTGRQVKEAVALCLETDLNIKSGLVRDEGALESLMLRILAMKKAETPARQA